jgi:hypothetical protein
MTAREQFEVRWGSCQGNFSTSASFPRVLGSMSERNVAKVGVSDGGNLSVWIGFLWLDRSFEIGEKGRKHKARLQRRQRTGRLLVFLM